MVTNGRMAIGAKRMFDLLIRQRGSVIFLETNHSTPRAHALDQKKTRPAANRARFLYSRTSSPEWDV
jgi:hypothetical protein